MEGAVVENDAEALGIEIAVLVTFIAKSAPVRDRAENKAIPRSARDLLSIVR
jgi:hypothetical protein